jgi:hypothetical protein
MVFSCLIVLPRSFNYFLLRCASRRCHRSESINVSWDKKELEEAKGLDLELKKSII